MLMTKAPDRMLNSYGHYTTSLLVIDPCAHELTLPRRLMPASVIDNISKNREEVIRIVDE
jgi:hypothetical protein